MQITTKAEVFNAFSLTLLSKVNNQFGGYNDASHRKLKSTSEKDLSWNSGTTSIVLEKQLLETFAHHCHNNFSLPKRMPPLDLNILLLILFPFIILDSLLLRVHVLIRNRIENQNISTAVMQTILKWLEK